MKAGSYYQSSESPAVDASSVTPSDSTDLPDGNSKSLYVANTGNVTVVMKNGTQVTFSAVPAGTILPIQVSRVLATGTTATGIVALY